MLLTEYFDESLILLKKLLCWTFDDILYISNGIRDKSHRYNVSKDLEERILRWNTGDVLLYDHFNMTFWQKVKEYGPEFWSDLEEFKKLEKETYDQCIDPKKINKSDRRVDKFVLNREHSDEHCGDILRGDLPYTSLLKQKLKTMAKTISHR